MAKELSVVSNAISFGEKLAASGTFKTLFRDGMALVEETASYLDGPGRDDAKTLPRTTALAYASESMRLTTRLMQIASWLLLQRAINEGEMSPAEAASDKRRTRLAWQQPPAKANVVDALPPPLLTLTEKSIRLQSRILRLDQMMSEPSRNVPAACGPGPLDQQMSLLREAFCG